MRHIKFILLASLLGVFSFDVKSQNFITNGGFEYGDDIPNGTYYTNTTSESLYNWERAKNTDGSDYHSPDWRYVSDSKYWGNIQNYDVDYNTAPQFDHIPFNPATGNAMLGMLHAELIQQQIDMNLVENVLQSATSQQLKLRFKIRIPNHTKPAATTKLYFYLSKNKLKYKNPDPDANVMPNSNDDYRKIGNSYSSYHTIYVDENLTGKYPPGQWHQIEALIDLPNNYDNYEWLGIDMRSYSSGDDKTGEYIYLDDIEITPVCNTTCSQTSGTNMTALYGNYIANFDNNTVRITNLDNVHTIDFSVYTMSGQIVYHNSTYCPNGIGHDLFWTGLSQSGAQLAIAHYKYVLKSANDCYQNTLTGTINKGQNYLGSITPNFNQECETGSNASAKACCIVDLYKDDETLYGPSHTDYIIQQNIWVCTHTPDFSDEVLIKSDADILFQAGKQITLREGFNTEPGAVFIAQIDPCDYSGIIEGGSTGGVTNPSGVSGMGQNNGNGNGLINETNPVVEIYPNPGNGIYTIKTKGVTEGNISIVDARGYLIHKQVIDKDKTIIDLSTKENGVYFFEITSKDLKETHKVIKQ